MTDFLWPSDMDRAEHEELQRVCEHLEQVVDERDEYRNHLAQICEMLGEMPNGKPDIGAAWESVAAVIAHQDKLVHELSACQRVLHSLAHHGQVTPDYASDAKAVIDSKPDASLAEVKVQAIDEFKSELAKSVSVIYRPHIEAVCAVVAQRIRQEAK